MPELIRPPNSDPGPETSAYVRQARSSEISAIVAVLTRAFARDPMMNWLGGVRALVPADHKGDQNDDANACHTLASLQNFELGLVKMVETGGLIVVVVEKEGTGDARAEDEGEGEGEGEKERVVGCALWTKPVTRKDPQPRSLLLVGRMVWSWGFRGFKVRLVCDAGSPAASDAAAAGGLLPRSGADSSILVQRMVFDFLPKVHKMFDEAFHARGLNCLDAWHLLQIGVDPAYQGKGGSHRLSALSLETSRA